MKKQQTGIKSSNKRWKELRDILYKGAVQILGFKSHIRIKKTFDKFQMKPTKIGGKKNVLVRNYS